MRADLGRRRRPLARPRGLALACALAAVLWAGPALSQVAPPPSGGLSAEVPAAPFSSATAGGAFVDPGLAGLGVDETLQHLLRIIFEPDLERLAADLSTVSAPPPLAKWIDPVFYVAIGDAATRDDIVALALAAARVERATPLAVRPATGGRPANLTAMVLTAAVRRQLAEEMRAESLSGADRPIDPVIARWLSDPGRFCSASFRLDPDRLGAIREALIVVKAEAAPDVKRACIERGLLQTFGLRHRHADVAPSLLNSFDLFAEPTAHDIRMLTVLYDPRVTPGLSRDEAALIFRDVILERAAAQ